MMQLTLRELTWMARGKRRDEWDRAGMMLAFLDNRFSFEEKKQVSDAIDFWPSDLVTDADRKAVQAAKRAKRRKPTSYMTMTEFVSMATRTPPRG